MKKIEVYDPPMCCSSGVCGTTINPELAEFQALLNKLKEEGFQVTRHNLAHEANKFPETIISAMGKTAEKLPIITINGKICFESRYPKESEVKEQLANE